MKYKALTKSIELENLSEGDVVDRKEYIEKLKVFEKYNPGGGTYVTDKTYHEYSEAGLHYYKYATLIQLFSQFSCKRVLVSFNKGIVLQEAR